MSELISVIVPVYNVEKYIDKCISSIVKQTYENIEVILVDDGSTDSSGRLCDGWLEKDGRIKVFHKVNGGLSDARNFGIDKAKGNYISFIDSDDYINQNLYEKLYNALIKKEADMAICNYDFVDEKGNILNENPNVLKNETISQIECYQKLIIDYNFYYVTAVNKLYKKALFKDLRFPAGKIHEDEFIIHHLIEKCRRVTIIEDVLYYYVQREDSIMNSNFNLKRFDGVLAMLDRYDFFKKINQNSMAIETLKHGYYILLLGISSMNITRDIGYIFKLSYEITKRYKFNLRVIKIYICFLKKLIKEILKKIKFQLILNFNLLKNHHNNKIFFIATPTHGNLGDQAIVLAEYQFCKMNFENKIIEIKNEDYLNYKNIIQKKVKEKDIIVIDGGGNLGTLWPTVDDKISDIIDTFHDNIIIVFPQTCYYELDSNGRKRMHKNINIYNKCKNLYIMFRDRQSYEFTYKYFKNVNIYYVPDIVLTLNLDYIGGSREGVLFCFRNDHEKVVSDKDISELQIFIEHRNIKTGITSTVINKYVAKRNRRKELYIKLCEFAQSRLVITDRLHGMIFAAITKTPCIALDNKSKKVSGVFEWIKNIPYIECVENFDEIYKIFDELYSFKDTDYDFHKLINNYEKVINDIKNIG